MSDVFYGVEWKWTITDASKKPDVVKGLYEYAKYRMNPEEISLLTGW